MNQPTETAGAATAQQAATNQGATVTKSPRKRTAKATVATTGAQNGPATDGNAPLLATGTNVPSALRQAADIIRRDEKEIARLQRLLQDTQRKLSETQGSVKYPVSTADLNKAIANLKENTRKHPDKPSRSLATQFALVDGAAVLRTDADPHSDAENATPDMTDDQRKLWRAARKEIDLMHSKWVRESAPKLHAAVKRLMRVPTAIGSGGMSKTKDGQLRAARIGARLPSTGTPGRGKNAAKPTVSP